MDTLLDYNKFPIKLKSQAILDKNLEIKSLLTEKMKEPAVDFNVLESLHDADNETKRS